jgi:cystathionine beta-lyase/cystathionine gamma-synthase
MTKRNFNVYSKALHHKVGAEGAKAAVTPIYQTSAFEAGSPYFYSRKSNPNCEELEEIISSFEGAKHSLSTTCGMSAISLVLSLLKPGEELAINKHIYGCSYKLFERFCSRYQIGLLVLDLSKEENFQKFSGKTKMAFFETPTNPFLNTIPIEPLARALKKAQPQARVVVDNTWATSYFQKPLKWGADISLHSATKYFSGHSDAMGGFLSTNDQALHESLKAERFYTGSILAPFPAWLIRRSLQTFPLRMRHHQEVTLKMAEFLRQRPEIQKVYYPCVGGQMEGYGGILFCELKDSLKDQYQLLSQSLELFNTGTGMACVTSMIAQPSTGSHASLSPAEQEEMGIQPSLVRLCFGMEEQGDLMADLAAGLDLIQEGRP